MNLIKQLVDDTLKRDKDGIRRFSETKITMFSAWCICVFAYFYDLFTFGFRTETFIVMVSVATGLKVTDAIGKKLNKDNNGQ